jgi:hypothetical protein
MSNRQKRGAQPPPSRRSLLQRLLANRYNPGSSWISIADVIENAKDTWFCWSRRLPPGSRLFRDADGKIKGAANRWRGPL